MYIFARYEPDPVTGTGGGGSAGWGPQRWLLADAQRVDQVTVALFAAAPEVIEHPTALADQLEQAASRVVVFAVTLKVLGEVGNPFAEESDLDFGRTRVRLVLGELGDDFLLALRSEAHCDSTIRSNFFWDSLFPNPALCQHMFAGGRKEGADGSVYGVDTEDEEKLRRACSAAFWKRPPGNRLM